MQTLNNKKLHNCVYLMLDSVIVVNLVLLSRGSLFDPVVQRLSLGTGNSFCLYSFNMESFGDQRITQILGQGELTFDKSSSNNTVLFHA